VAMTDAVVGIRASGCSLVDNFGTGVAVAPKLIATSAHTIAGSTEITVVDQVGGQHPAHVVGFDPRRDVAILMVANSMPHATLGAGREGDNGVLSSWHPDDGFATADVSITRLLRVTIEDIYVGAVSERLAFEIDADVVKGGSGGPIFGPDGTVAGIIYAASRDREGVAFALRSEEIARVLQEVSGVPVNAGRCA